MTFGPEEHSTCSVPLATGCRVRAVSTADAGARVHEPGTPAPRPGARATYTDACAFYSFRTRAKERRTGASPAELAGIEWVATFKAKLFRISVRIRSARSAAVGPPGPHSPILKITCPRHEPRARGPLPIQCSCAPTPGTEPGPPIASGSCRHSADSRLGTCVPQRNVLGSGIAPRITHAFGHRASLLVASGPVARNE